MKQPELYHRIESDDEDDCKTQYIVKATLVIITIAVCFAVLLCTCNPF